MEDLTQHPRVLMIDRLATYLLPMLSIEADDIDDIMTSMASYLDEARRCGIEDCIVAIEDAAPTKIGAVNACRDLLRISEAKRQRAGNA